MPKNFLKVDDGLFRGGKPSANDLSILKNKFGIQRVVSLDGESGIDIDDECKKLGLEHSIIPLTDGNSKNLPVIEKNLDKLFNSGKKTYVHCFHGRDRTGMVCAIYRIANGWPLEKALKEAYEIGMGLPLDPATRKSYYNAVMRFDYAKDSNYIADDDIGSLHGTGEIASITPGINDSSISNPMQMSFAPYAGDVDSSSVSMNSFASGRIYTFSKSNDLLNPHKVWYFRKDILNKINHLNNEYLFSADIYNDADIENIDKNYNKVLVQSANINGKDVVIFRDGIIIVLNPNALINIKEETLEDSNNIVDVGLRSNYEGLAQNVAPGSGGMMDQGYGGFGGYVQMPNQEF